MWEPATELDNLISRYGDAADRAQRIEAAADLAFANRRDPEAARRYIAETRDLIGDDGDEFRPYIAYCDYVEQFILGDQGECVEAIRIGLRLLDVFTDLEDQWGLVSTMLSLTNNYNMMNDPESSQPIAARLRRLDDDGHVPGGLKAAVYYELANTYDQLGVPEVARAYANRVLEFDEFRYGGVYMLGLIEIGAANLRAARTAYEEAREIGLQERNRLWMLLATARLCETLRKTGEPDRAAAVARADMSRFAIELDNAHGELLLELGLALSAKGEPDEAHEQMVAALEVFESIGASATLLAKVQTALAELCYSAERYQEAADRFYKANQLQDDVARKDRIGQLALASVRHEYDLSQQELEFANAQADALWETNQQLREANDDQKEILAIVAHDLTNPLTSVALTADLIDQLDRDDTAGADTQLRRIRSSVDYMLEVVSQLTAMGRIDAGDVELSLNAVSIGRVVDMSVERNRAAIAASRAELDIDIDPTLLVAGDIVSLERVFDNLISNAVKYSPSDSRIWIKAQEHNGWVSLSVTDRGVGMEAEEMDRLFTKFGRLSARPTVAGAPSTGLGLYIAKQFIEMMDGRITGDSPGPGLGSTFTVTLRAADQPAVPNTPAVPQAFHDTSVKE